MYKLPTLGSIAQMVPSPKEVESFQGEDMEQPFSYQPGALPSQFPYSPKFGEVSEEDAAERKFGNLDSGTPGGASVADVFRMNQAPYTRENVYDLTNSIMNSRSPYNPGGTPSPMDTKHWVRPPNENMTNKFFSKPFDQMNPREQTNFHAYHPNINKATEGMSSQESRAYADARFGYNNSAYFKVRPETKKTFEDMVAGYKPLDQRVEDRKNNV